VAVEVERVLCHNQPREHQTRPVRRSRRPPLLDLREGGGAERPLPRLMAAGPGTAAVSVPVPGPAEPGVCGAGGVCVEESGEPGTLRGAC